MANCNFDGVARKLDFVPKGKKEREREQNSCNLYANCMLCAGEKDKARDRREREREKRARL